MYRTAKALLTRHVGLLVFGLTAVAVLWGVLRRRWPADGRSAGVFVWWSALCAVSVLNICAWRLSAAALARRKPADEPARHTFRRRQLVLSAVYVLGCAFRSVLPRADVQRIGLVDTWLSSVMVGRSVATVAELCFVAQWALLLHQAARDAGARYVPALAKLLVPLVLVAEVCSWYAVLTTCYLGNAVEESIWALSVSLVMIGALTLRPQRPAAYRPFLAAALVLGAAYLTFMCTVDVPMYVSRWLADEASGRQYLSVSQGLWDVGSRWTVTFRWEEWRREVPWMSLYFSVAVWCSIALAHAPWPDARPDAARHGPQPG